MRRKENSFLRLLFYGSGKGGENRNLILLFFYFFFPLTWEGKEEEKEWNKVEKGKEKTLFETNKVWCFFYILSSSPSGSEGKDFCPGEKCEFASKYLGHSHSNLTVISEVLYGAFSAFSRQFLIPFSTILTIPQRKCCQKCCQVLSALFWLFYVNNIKCLWCFLL